MKLVFEQTPEHVKSFQKNHLANYSFLKYALIAGIIMVITNLILSSSQPFTEALLSWALPIFLIIGMWYFILKFIIARNISKNKDILLGKREIEIFDEKIFCKTEFSETNLLWNGFLKMEESSICYFLYMGTQQALIIPKNAFDNDAQKSEFEALAKSKIRK